MTRKTVLILLLLVILVIAIVYVALGPPKINCRIRIVTPPSIIASLPVWVAQEEGLFKREFLDMELVNITDSKLMVEALLADNADVLPAVSLADLATTGSLGNLALMKAKVYSHSRMRKSPPFESLLVSTGSKIASLKDLENAKIAVYPGMTSELALRYFLRVSGVNDNLVTFVKLPPPEHYPALSRNDVQAIHIYEPFRSFSLENGKTRELIGSVYASLTDPCAIGVSAISRRFLKDNPDAAARFFRVWNNAVQLIRDNPEKCRRILAKYLSLPDAIALKATWVDVTKTSETSFDILEKTFKMFQDAGVIPAEFILEKDMVFSQ